ncbi:MAG: sigma-54-dependent Fis family transcriptional regulator [Rhodoferax sp.]|nr:sigma-54-dependent Fis family transcriptional regulator [Rhodoferax sp.]
MTAALEIATQDGLSLPKQIIIESHARCRYQGLKPYESSDYSAQALADFRLTLERNARLIAQASSVVEMLGKRVGDFGSMIVLTDGTGTILRTRCQSAFNTYAEKVALRPGVAWSESSKGTNAIGTALVLETDIYVHGDEHYIQSNHFLSCAASPIVDHSGNVIGVLDVSGDQRSFHPHTMMLVEMCARTIENNWFRDKFRQALQLHFHTQAELIGTAEEGTIAFDEDGRIMGTNRAGLHILGTSASALRVQGLRALFGLGFGELMDTLRLASFTPLKMHQPNGREIYVRVSWSGATISANFRSVPSAAAQPSPALPAPALARPGTPPAAKKAQLQLDDLDCGDVRVRAVTQKLRHVIDKDISILILGETGTGKELLANAIHQFSQRRERPFVAINCASIPEQLIESELFGYEEGAFTGAKRKGAAGKLLQANGGTLFLDEIGDMPLSLQARLLRVLQERKVVPLGGHQAMDIDVNLICATHRNLRELIDQRAFREDLYYRINGISVKLPSLRERTDLAALCQKILRVLAPTQALRIQPKLMEAFLRYSWPGNLRQLNNVLKTAAIMASDGAEITTAHLADDFHEELAALVALAPLPRETAGTPSFSSLTDPLQASSTPTAPASPMDNLEQVEIATIRRALDACGGNVSSASKLLNISRNTIYRKLKKQE